MQKDEPDTIRTYPLLTLKNVVLFPGTVRTLFFNRPQSLEALKDAAEYNREVFVVTIANDDHDQLTQDDLYTVGVIGRVSKLQRLPNGAMQILFEAKQRGMLLHADLTGKMYEARVQHIHSRESADYELPQMVEALKNEFFKYLDQEKKSSAFQWSENLDSKTVPAGVFADAVAPLLKAPLHEMQDILATLDTRERVEKIYTMLIKELKQREYEQRLKSRVEEALEKRQREFYLNEQMKAIQEELGEEAADEFGQIAKAIEAANMPENVLEVAQKELNRLKKMGNNSHEATPVRNYLDWLTSLPWQIKTEDTLDIQKAEEVLDAAHYGLDKPKERILEFIAVSQAVGKLKGPIICLSGPPGVGKTSLAKAIAASLDRRFARISLGGVRDEAEIRGHRRTYVGSMPGKLLQTMKKTGTLNPVILLDEIDKLSHYHLGGGPIAALLEVLDPEQNHSFMDHYLEVEYDLSKVLFITTANNLADIPLPLRDRMEIIELSGYTELEKLEIAKRYLLPKQMEENGLNVSDLSLSDTMILEVIRGYTREAGVRSLDRTLGKLCRKVVTDKLKRHRKQPIKLNARRLEKYLGVAKFHHAAIEQNNGVGMVTGLAWTSVGGETLSIEVTTMRGNGKVQITGTLGEVMQESAKAALSYVRANANALGIYAKVFKETDIHIHVPAGGTPKDGPSAGIALASAIVSALTGIPVHWDVGLTGEVTLRGNVLPIGGLKEKLLAAKRAQLKKVLIPHANRSDLTEIAPEILKNLEVKAVKHVSEVFPNMLEYLPAAVNDDDLPEPIQQGNRNLEVGVFDTPDVSNQPAIDD